MEYGKVLRYVAGQILKQVQDDGRAKVLLLSGQRGAMFGMDARIALIVAAILTAAGGISYMTRLERSKVDAAQKGAEDLRAAVLKYYQQVSINALPDALEQVFAANLVEDPGERKDPWGNPWNYEKFATTVSVQGTPVTVNYAVIYSNGKDGVANSPALTGDADYAQWEPLKDDVGVKLTTRDVELQRLNDYRERAKLIQEKLENAESTAFLEAQSSCTGTTPPAWCNDTTSKNYTQFNYLPPSDADAVDGMVSYQVKILSKPAYRSGDENDMRQLMTDIGLSPDYAKDPWGRTIQYSSNITHRADPPFSASFCFSFAESCFGGGQ